MKFAHCCKKRPEEGVKPTENTADDGDAEKVRSALDLFFCLFESGGVCIFVNCVHCLCTDERNPRRD